MAMGKKGSRKIVVGARAFRWRVTPWRRVSDWTPADAGLVDERWLARARAVGLGDAADVVFNVAIESYENPRGHLLVRYYAKIVDGFLGPEQFTQLKPAFVRAVVERALAAGWAPDATGSLEISVVENQEGEAARMRPAILILDAPTAADLAYENRVVAIRLR